MTADESETTIQSLLDLLGKAFDLDRSFGERSLGDRLEEIIRTAAATEAVEFGVPHRLAPI